MALIDVARAQLAIFDGDAERTLSAEEEAQVEVFIDAASERIERLCIRHFSEDNYVEKHHGGFQELVLNHYPITGINSIEIAGSEVAVGDYESEDEQGLVFLVAGGKWPTTNRQIEVDYDAGYETIPEDIQDICAWMVAGLFWTAKSDPRFGQQWRNNLPTDRQLRERLVLWINRQGYVV